MTVQLVVIAGPDKGRSFPLKVGEILLVGRSKTSGTRLADPHVSRVHCQVEFDGTVAVIKDFQSASGTFVNDKRIDQCQLNSGDVLLIGTTKMQLHTDVEEQNTVVAKKQTPSAVHPALPGTVDITKLVGASLGTYQIDAMLAKGRTSYVFRAHQTGKDRTVALKVLKPEVMTKENERQRFIRAMKTMLPLRHPNLITLHGAGQARGLCWLALDYVDGENMMQVIRRIGVAGMLDWRTAFRVVRDIAQGLAYAHSHQIIHRGVTPKHIYVRNSDKVALLGNLMLAKAMEGTLAQEITTQGELVGDLDYMAPEQTQGHAHLDERSDIYGLGATLYTVVTGRTLFEGASLAKKVTQIREDEPVPPRQVNLSIPIMFEGMIMKMVAKRPEARYQSADDVLEELERIDKAQLN